MATTPRIAPATLVATVFILLVSVASAQFASCVVQNAAGATLRDPSQNDWNFHSTRSLYPSPIPNYIVAVFSVQQVQEVVKCATANGIGLCVRAGGHSFVGSSQCSGVQLDIRGLDSSFYDENSQDITLGMGNTLGEMYYQVLQSTGFSRMIGIGLCPSVGIGGYLLGGGHNPYSGLLGLTCDSVKQYKIVLPNGDLVTANSGQNQELFWASCGGGGGHFGVAVEATVHTHDAGVYNNNVYFRFSWPRSVAGQVMSGWVDWDQDGGNSWMRLEVNQADSPLFGYGVCWGASSTDECLGRLEQQPWFNQPGRSTNLIHKAANVADFQAFIGPAGDWANKVPQVTPEQALLNKIYSEAGLGPNRIYESMFWKFSPSGKAGPAEYQQMADACASANGNLVSFIVCQFNPFEGALKTPQNNAFVHRDMDMFFEYIGASQTGDAGLNELARVGDLLKNIGRKYVAGIYVSYPEFDLATNDYTYLYWGKNAQRLANLRNSLDPNSLFDQVQEMPIGQIQCPGELSVNAPSSTTRQISINGYSIGQMAGMSTVFSLSPGCGVNIGASQGADVYTVGNNYGATVHNDAPFTITVTNSNGSPASCAIGTVEVNGIACSGNPGPPAPPTENCYANGERCQGAPGFPFVQWKPCCESGASCVDDESKGWGKWCTAEDGTSPPAPPADNCYANGERCQGAPGFPFVQWKPCCESGASCVDDESKGWGKWCTAEGTSPPSPPPADNCYANGERCQGAPGFPFVQWKPCCESGASCVDDESKGWGKWCTPEGTSPPPADNCYANGERCQGAPGFPFVQWKPCCDSGASCVDDESKGWGKWCQ